MIMACKVSWSGHLGKIGWDVWGLRLRRLKKRGGVGLVKECASVHGIDLRLIFRALIAAWETM